MDRDAKKAELDGFIAKSRRNMRTLGKVLVLAALVCVGVCFANRTVGLIALFIVGAIAVSGFWILAAHVADWKLRLEKLDEPPAPPAIVMRGRGHQRG